MANNMFTWRLNRKKPNGRPRQRRADNVRIDLAEMSQGTRIDNSEDSDR